MIVIVLLLYKLQYNEDYKYKGVYKYRNFQIAYIIFVTRTAFLQMRKLENHYYGLSADKATLFLKQAFKYEKQV